MEEAILIILIIGYIFVAVNVVSGMCSKMRLAAGE